MYTRKQALALAKQFRTCPPLKVKEDPRHADQVRNHLAICPFCSTSLKDEKEAFELLSDSLTAGRPQSQRNPTPAPGQVRMLDQSLGGWQGNFFYNPPEVLIISEEDGVFTGAQVWYDLSLAGPGDLILPKKMRKGLPDFFAETWNIYCVAPSAIGQCVGVVTPGALNAVLEMDRNPDYLPRWSSRPAPLGDDPRIFFREIELKAAGHAFNSMYGAKGEIK